jgi:tRNA(fMet)-specific endonuclease VapC
VGTLLDTTVFIDLERAVRSLPAATAMAEVGRRLEGQLGLDEEVGIAAITASELLHEAFVEAVLAAFPPLPFELLAARAHARIWAQLAASGQDVGAHDRIVAATAISAGWRIGTANRRHFDQIVGLDVLPIFLTS